MSRVGSAVTYFDYSCLSTANTINNVHHHSPNPLHAISNSPFMLQRTIPACSNSASVDNDISGGGVRQSKSATHVGYLLGTKMNILQFSKVLTKKHYNNNSNREIRKRKTKRKTRIYLLLHI